MTRWLPILASLFLSPCAWAQTTVYAYTGNVLLVSNYTAPCGTGPCADFPSGTHWTGQFTTASPLPSNLSTYTEVTTQVTSFSFSDGLNVFANSNPNMRVGFFFVQTDAGGNITVASIGASLWQSGSSPHSGTNRVAYMQINSPDYAYNNGTCSLIGVSYSGVPDSCKVLPTVDASTSFGSQGVANPGLWSESNGAPPALVSAVSRKAHGSAGTFDLPLQ